MSCSRSFFAVFLLAASACSAATPPAQKSYACPAAVTVAGVQHVLTHYDVFDTPPENGASLMPTRSARGDGWWDLQGRDIYLRCVYQGVAEPTIIYAPGVTACRETAKSATIQCR